MTRGEFKEIQRFSRWWHYLLVSLPALFFLLTGLLASRDKHGQPIHFSDLLIPFIASLLLIVWFLCLRLTTIINDKGIAVRFSGIPFAHKMISWSEVQKAELVQYSPLSDYGGWGVRYGFSNGWCYNVSGKTGLKLGLSTGKPFLIGTQQKELLQQTLTHYFHP